MFQKKTSLKINGAEGKPWQPLGVFQLTRLFQVTRTSLIYGDARGHMQASCSSVSARRPQIQSFRNQPGPQSASGYLGGDCRFAVWTNCPREGLTAGGNSPAERIVCVHGKFSVRAGPG
jgi:hypothetical protein